MSTSIGDHVHSLHRPLIRRVAHIVEVWMAVWRTFEPVAIVGDDSTILSHSAVVHQHDRKPWPTPIATARPPAGDEETFWTVHQLAQLTSDAEPLVELSTEL